MRCAQSGSHMALNFKLACSDRSTTGSGSWTGTALFRTQPALQATLHELRTLGQIELETKLQVCKSVHQSTIQINHQPDATILQFILLTFIYSSTCFGHSPAHHHELNDWSSSLPFYLRIVVIAVLCSWSGRPAETCWAVNNRQDNKLENCCIWLVIYLNW